MQPGQEQRKRGRDLSSTIAVPAAKRLRASSVKPVTLARYSQAVAELDAWAAKHRRSLNVKYIDRTIVDFLHQMCQAGRSIVDARSVVYGFILLRMNSDLPERLLLSQSKAALKGWSSRFPNHSRAGVDLMVWDVVAWQCLQNDDPLSAAAILLQGDTYMRPSEILSMRKQSIIKPRKSRSSFWGVVIGSQDLHIPTKTGLFDDCVLLDSPGREDLGVVLKYLLKHSDRDTGKLLHGLSLRAYGDAIKKACEMHGLHSLKLTPHVLRHSGPSTDAYHGVRSLAAIQQRGRWKTQSSVARYQKPGRMLLLHQSVPDAVWKKAPSCRKRALEFFRCNLA